MFRPFCKYTLLEVLRQAIIDDKHAFDDALRASVGAWVCISLGGRHEKVFGYLCSSDGACYTELSA